MFSFQSFLEAAVAVLTSNILLLRHRVAAQSQIRRGGVSLWSLALTPWFVEPGANMAALLATTACAFLPVLFATFSAKGKWVTIALTSPTRSCGGTAYEMLAALNIRLGCSNSGSL